MLEAIQADKLHQILQFRYLNHSAGSKRVKRIIGKMSVTEIGANLSRGIIGADPAKTHRTSRRPPGQCADGVFFAKHGAENRGGADANVGKKIPGPVAAVKKDTLIRVVAVVVVPVHKSAGPAAGELQGIHADHSRD